MSACAFLVYRIASVLLGIILVLIFSFTQNALSPNHEQVIFLFFAVNFEQDRELDIASVQSLITTPVRRVWRTRHK